MPPKPLDRTSHLALDPAGVVVTEFEFAVWRFSSAFVRWQGDCMACATPSGLSGQDAAILHVIRMRDMPKTLSEIGRLLNRDDVANILDHARAEAAPEHPPDGRADRKGGIRVKETNQLHRFSHGRRRHGDL